MRASQNSLYRHLHYLEQRMPTDLAPVCCFANQSTTTKGQEHLFPALRLFNGGDKRCVPDRFSMHECRRRNHYPWGGLSSMNESR
jgi:hypothetical protein